MEELDIPRRTLSEKMAKLGLDRQRFVESDRQKSANESEGVGGKPPKAVSYSKRKRPCKSNSTSARQPGGVSISFSKPSR